MGDQATALNKSTLPLQQPLDEHHEPLPEIASPALPSGGRLLRERASGTVRTPYLSLPSLADPSSIFSG